MLECGASSFSDFYTLTNMDEVVTLLKKWKLCFQFLGFFLFSKFLENQ